MASDKSFHRLEPATRQGLQGLRIPSPLTALRHYLHRNAHLCTLFALHQNVAWEGRGRANIPKRFQGSDQKGCTAEGVWSPKVCKRRALFESFAEYFDMAPTISHREGSTVLQRHPPE
mmetsp:Transcript_77506/g.136712  ORF Transcript_77506/g.136712 Transcript_77506/m.136712 type:complete len:118 (-) Transcript_77506:31-384(-)